MKNKKETDNKTQRKISTLNIIIHILGIIVSVLLVLATSSGLFKPSKHAFIACVGIFFVYFFIATFLYFIFLVVKRKKMAIPILIALFISLPSISRNVKFFSKENDNQDNALTVISFNVKNLSNSNKNLGENDIADKIFKKIEDCNADVIMVQEYYGEDEYLLDFLKQRTNTNYHCYTKYYPASRNCIAILSKYKIFNIESIRDNKKSIALYCDMQYKGDTIRVINTHLQSIHVDINDLNTAKESTDKAKIVFFRLYNSLSKAFCAREKQTDIMSDVIEKSPYRIILCGDFNDTPCSYTYKQISKQLTDVFVESGKGFGFTFKDLPFIRIDYMFHSDGIKSVKYDIIRADGISDHDLSIGKFIIE